MKLVFVSDTHNQQNRLQLPTSDILIHTGDFTMDGSEVEVKNFLNWLVIESERQPDRDIVFIAGNHDRYCERHKNDFRKMLELLPPTIHYLYRESVIVKDLTFYGSPLQKDLKNWAFHSTDDSVWDQIPNTTDILLTHVPPHGLGDQVNTLFEGEVDYHIGNKALRKRVESLSCLVHAYGHIHEGYGEYRYENNITRAINSSSLNHQYRLTNPPVEIDI